MDALKFAPLFALGLVAYAYVQFSMMPKADTRGMAAALSKGYMANSADATKRMTQGLNVRTAPIHVPQHVYVPPTPPSFSYR